MGSKHQGQGTMWLEGVFVLYESLYSTHSLACCSLAGMFMHPAAAAVIFHTQAYHILIVMRNARHPSLCHRSCWSCLPVDYFASPLCTLTASLTCLSF